MQFKEHNPTDCKDGKRHWFRNKDGSKRFTCAKCGCWNPKADKARG